MNKREVIRLCEMADVSLDWGKKGQPRASLILTFTGKDRQIVKRWYETTEREDIINDRFFHALVHDPKWKEFQEKPVTKYNIAKRKEYEYSFTRAWFARDAKRRARLAKKK